MTVKKNNSRVPATAHRTNKARKHKAPKTEVTETAEAVPSQTALPDELLATETPTHPTPEFALTETPMLAPGEAAMADQAEERTQGEATPLPTATPLSALEAALRVLGESGQALSCPELIAVMAAKNYWSSPTGRTPASTLYACLLREMKTKGDKARMIKTTRGKFALRPTV